MTISKRSLFTLLATAFISMMSFGIVFPVFFALFFGPKSHFLSPGTSDLLRGFLLGVALSLGPISQFFSTTYVGVLSDQRGRKPILIMTKITIIIGYLISAWAITADNLILLLIGQIFIGFGSGNISVANAAIADVSLPKEKAKNYGTINMASGLGFAIGPFIGGKLSLLGLSKPFIFAALITSANAILIVLWFMETHHIKEKIKTIFTIGLKSLGESLKLPGIATIFISFFIFCCGWTYYWNFISVLWIKGFGLNVSQVANFYGYGSLFYVLSSGFLIRPILKKVPLGIILLLSWFLLGFTLLPLIHLSLEWYWLFLPLQQIVVAFIFAVGTAMVSNATEIKQGEILGLFQSAQTFAFAFTPLFGGVIVGVNYYTPLIIGAVSVWFSCFVLLAGYRKKIFEEQK